MVIQRKLIVELLTMAGSHYVRHIGARSKVACCVCQGLKTVGVQTIHLRCDQKYCVETDLTPGHYLCSSVREFLRLERGAAIEAPGYRFIFLHGGYPCYDFCNNVNNWAEEGGLAISMS